MSEKYYFDTNFSKCIEKCQALNDGTMIGSASCQECLFCADSEDDSHPDWISCERISEATGEQPTRKPILKFKEKDSRAIFANKIIKNWLSQFKNLEKALNSIDDFKLIEEGLTEHVRNIYELESTEIPFLHYLNYFIREGYDAEYSDYTKEEFEQAKRDTYYACLKFYFE